MGNGHEGTHSSLLERKRRCRERQARGIVVLPVEVDGPIIGLFLRTPGMAITVRPPPPRAARSLVRP
jgi:hypothetical protein